MSELRDLYQEIILDHGKSPRNFRKVEASPNQAKGYNPLCGDSVQVFLTIDKAGLIADAAFQGRGCAISIASASLMTEAIKGKTVPQAQALFDEFRHLVTEADDHGHNHDDLGPLVALGGVRQYPSRVKCATLAWHTMVSAAAGEVTSPVTTE